MEQLLRRRSVEQLQPEANNLIEKYVGSKRSREAVMLGYVDIIEDILEPSELVTLAFSKQIAPGEGAPGAAAAEVKVKAEPKAEGGEAGMLTRRPSVGSHMLSIIASELNLSPLQLDHLAEHRNKIHKDREILVTCSKLVAELRAKITAHIQNQHKTLGGMRKILNPTQVAKYVMWVEKSKKQMKQAAEGH